MHNSRGLRAITTALLLLASTCLTAQTTINGSLHGTVLDPSGGQVAGAHVLLENQSMATRLDTETSEDGSYVFGRIPPGEYVLTAERSGFRKLERAGIQIAVNQAAEANLTLVVGDVRNVVSIVADAEILQTRSSEVSGLVSERRVRDLPLNGRNFNKLLFLAPGVQGGPDFNNPAISGSRPAANTYTIDGSNTSDERAPYGISGEGGASSGSYGGAGGNLVSTEAIQEFRVITANADATFGRGSGGQINIVTKAGSNTFHGSAYEYLRNNALDARNFFNYGPFRDDQGNAKVPPFRQNLFGGTVGGPIRKDRHFFFGNYEGLRQKLQSSATATLPNADLISVIPGDFSKYFRTFYIDRGLIPSTGNAAGTFSPLSAAVRTSALAAGFPARLFDGDPSNGEAGTVLVSASPLRDVTQNQFLIRTDHRLTDKYTTSVRYGFAQPHLTSGSAAAPIDLSTDDRRWQSAEWSNAYTLSPSQIFELRLGVLRSTYITGNLAGADQRLINIGVDRQLGLGLTFDTGLAAPSTSPHAGFIDNQTIPQASLLHTWVRGKLTLRSGFDIRLMDLNVANVSGAQAIYTFNGYVGRGGILGEAFGQPQALAASARLVAFGQAGAPTGPMRGWRSSNEEFFTQADWRIRRDLTINAGLRYSYFGVYSEVNNAASNLYAVDPAGKIVDNVTPFQFGRAANMLASIGPGRPFYQPDYNNVAPRIGASWDVFGRGRSVIRAAYGIYYDRIYHLVFSNNISNAPQAVSSSVAFTPFLLSGTVPISATTPVSTSVDPTIRNPYTHRFNVGFEQRMDASTTISVAYVGACGRLLLKAVEPNGSGGVPQALRPDPNFSDQKPYGNYGYSNYNGLQVFAHRRWARGVDFSAAYTYSKSRDNASIDRDFGRTPSIINTKASAAAPAFANGLAHFIDRPQSADYGASDFDVRHYLTFSHVVELPFGRGRAFLSQSPRWVEALSGGWSVAGVGTMRRGEPFSLTLGVDYNSDGDSVTDRPALLSGSLGDLYTNGSQGRIQYLLPTSQTAGRLGIPSPVNDPKAALERNALQGPSLYSYDLSVLRVFPIKERLHLRFEANAFNVFNHANFASPTGNLTSALFGRLTATRAGTTPRQIQLGLKVTF